MNTEKRKPSHELRLGSIKAAIWKNQSEKSGIWYSVTINRLYKKGDSWKRSDSFGPNDLPLVSKIVDMASHWIQLAATPAAALQGDASTMPNV